MSCVIRPLPKWMIYIVKMVATWTTTVVLTMALVALTQSVIYARSDVPLADALHRGVKVAEIHSLAVVAYASIFGLLGLLIKRSLIVGMIYTVVIEGLLANLPLSLRMGTVIYYSRIIAYRTLDFVVHWPRGNENDVAATVWSIVPAQKPSLTDHPQLATCIWILVGISVIGTVVADWLCSQSEFHVKTPEKD